MGLHSSLASSSVKPQRGEWLRTSSPGLELDVVVVEVEVVVVVETVAPVFTVVVVDEVVVLAFGSVGPVEFVVGDNIGLEVGTPVGF